MSKILTAEEFLIDWMGIDNSTHPNIDIKNQWLERKNQLIKFAKLHCEAQQEAILENVKIREDELNPSDTDEIKNTILGKEFEADKGYEDYCPHKYTVDEDSIINAYPLTNIE